MRQKVIKTTINEYLYNNYPITNMDDYSDDIIIKDIYKLYNNSLNNNLISESSLNRILSLRDREWAIITAHRSIFTKEENIKRNRILRGKLNDKKIGVHQLVGHWRECTIPGISYDDCPDNKLKDVIERSYFVVKPYDIDTDDFYSLIIELMTIENQSQDAFIYHKPSNSEIQVIGIDGTIYDRFKDWKMGRIGQAYSQYIKKMNVPFIFEGMEIPGSNSGKMVMKYENIKYV